MDIEEGEIIISDISSESEEERREGHRQRTALIYCENVIPKRKKCYKDILSQSFNFDQSHRKKKNSRKQRPKRTGPSVIEPITVEQISDRFVSNTLKGSRSSRVNKQKRKLKTQKRKRDSISINRVSEWASILEPLNRRKRKSTTSSLLEKVISKSGPHSTPSATVTTNNLSLMNKLITAGLAKKPLSSVRSDMHIEVESTITLSSSEPENCADESSQDIKKEKNISNNNLRVDGDSDSEIEVIIPPKKIPTVVTLDSDGEEVDASNKKTIHEVSKNSDESKNEEAENIKQPTNLEDIDVEEILFSELLNEGSITLGDFLVQSNTETLVEVSKNSDDADNVALENIKQPTNLEDVDEEEKCFNVLLNEGSVTLSDSSVICVDVDEYQIHYSPSSPSTCPSVEDKSNKDIDSLSPTSSQVLYYSPSLQSNQTTPLGNSRLLTNEKDFTPSSFIDITSEDLENQHPFCDESQDTILNNDGVRKVHGEGEVFITYPNLELGANKISQENGFDILKISFSSSEDIGKLPYHKKTSTSADPVDFEQELDNINGMYVLNKRNYINNASKINTPQGSNSKLNEEAYSPLDSYATKSSINGSKSTDTKCFDDREDDLNSLQNMSLHMNENCKYSPNKKCTKNGDSYSDQSRKVISNVINEIVPLEQIEGLTDEQEAYSPSSNYDSGKYKVDTPTVTSPMSKMETESIYSVSSPGTSDALRKSPRDKDQYLITNNNNPENVSVNAKVDSNRITETNESPIKSDHNYTRSPVKHIDPTSDNISLLNVVGQEETHQDRNSEKAINSDEEDLSQLRLIALSTKGKINQGVKSLGCNENITQSNTSADDDDCVNEAEEIELRVAALKSAVIKKHEKRKKRGFLIKKRKRAGSGLGEDIFLIPNITDKSDQDYPSENVPLNSPTGSTGSLQGEEDMEIADSDSGGDIIQDINSEKLPVNYEPNEAWALAHVSRPLPNCELIPDNLTTIYNTNSVTELVPQNLTTGMVSENPPVSFSDQTKKSVNIMFYPSAISPPPPPPTPLLFPSLLPPPPPPPPPPGTTDEPEPCLPFSVTNSKDQIAYSATESGLPQPIVPGVDCENVIVNPTYSAPEALNTGINCSLDISNAEGNNSEFSITHYSPGATTNTDVKHSKSIPQCDQVRKNLRTIPLVKNIQKLNLKRKKLRNVRRKVRKNKLFTKVNSVEPALLCITNTPSLKTKGKICLKTQKCIPTLCTEGTPDGVDTNKLTLQEQDNSITLCTTTPLVLDNWEEYEEHTLDTESSINKDEDISNRKPEDTQSTQDIQDEIDLSEMIVLDEVGMSPEHKVSYDQYTDNNDPKEPEEDEDILRVRALTSLPSKSSSSHDHSSKLNVQTQLPYVQHKKNKDSYRIVRNETDTVGRGGVRSNLMDFENLSVTRRVDVNESSKYRLTRVVSEPRRSVVQARDSLKVVIPSESPPPILSSVPSPPSVKRFVINVGVDSDSEDDGEWMRRVRIQDNPAPTHTEPVVDYELEKLERSVDLLLMSARQKVENISSSRTVQPPKVPSVRKKTIGPLTTKSDSKHNLDCDLSDTPLKLLSKERQEEYQRLKKIIEEKEGLKHQQLKRTIINRPARKSQSPLQYVLVNEANKLTQAVTKHSGETTTKRADKTSSLAVKDKQNEQSKSQERKRIIMENSFAQTIDNSEKARVGVFERISKPSKIEMKNSTINFQRNPRRKSMVYYPEKNKAIHEMSQTQQASINETDASKIKSSVGYFLNEYLPKSKLFDTKESYCEESVKNQEKSSNTTKKQTHNISENKNKDNSSSRIGTEAVTENKQSTYSHVDTTLCKDGESAFKELINKARPLGLDMFKNYINSTENTTTQCTGCDKSKTQRFSENPRTDSMNITNITGFENNTSEMKKTLAIDQQPAVNTESNYTEKNKSQSSNKTQLETTSSTAINNNPVVDTADPSICKAYEEPLKEACGTVDNGDVNSNPSKLLESQNDETEILAKDQTKLLCERFTLIDELTEMFESLGDLEKEQTKLGTVVAEITYLRKALLQAEEKLRTQHAATRRLEQSLLTTYQAIQTQYSNVLHLEADCSQRGGRLQGKDFKLCISGKKMLSKKLQQVKEKASKTKQQKEAIKNEMKNSNVSHEELVQLHADIGSRMNDSVKEEDPLFMNFPLFQHPGSSLIHPLPEESVPTVSVKTSTESLDLETQFPSVSLSSPKPTEEICKITSTISEISNNKTFTLSNCSESQSDINSAEIFSSSNSICPRNEGIDTSSTQNNSKVSPKKRPICDAPDEESKTKKLDSGETKGPFVGCTVANSGAIVPLVSNENISPKDSDTKPIISHRPSSSKSAFHYKSILQYKGCNYRVKKVDQAQGKEAIICPYDLSGKCQDQQCPYQHFYPASSS